MIWIAQSMHAMAFGVTDTRGHMHTRQLCEVLPGDMSMGDLDKLPDKE